MRFSRADAAISVSSVAQVASIFLSVLVAAFALSAGSQVTYSGRIGRSVTDTTIDILAMRDKLQMRRIDAAANSASVVEIHPEWLFPVDSFPREHVGVGHLFSVPGSYSGVSVPRCASHPKQATAVRFGSYKVGKSFVDVASFPHMEAS